MNGMRLNRSGLNMSRLNASLLNASGIGAMGCKGKATMEDRIRESMVLWYDLAKQGATNEGMAADPRIIDNSGNGHHAACHNFAWSGMSGVGGYAIDFNNWFSQSATAWKITNKTYKTLIFKCISASIKELTYINQGKFEKKNFSLQITSNNPELKFELIALFNNSTSSRIIKQNEDGVIQTDYSDEEFNTIRDVYPTLRITADTFSFLKKDDIITIEQLPLYPHALVSDGVDDYAQTQPFHIPKEFTVMWDVDWLGEGTSANSGFVKPNSFFVYRGDSADNIIAFINNVASYDSIPKDTFCISGLTAYDKEYNAVALTDAQDVNESTDYLGIFRGSVNSDVVSMAFRKFLLFDRVLTLEEIEWVKTNLMSE